MKRKDDESGSSLDLIPVDDTKPHKKKRLGYKGKEKDTSPSSNLDLLPLDLKLDILTRLRAKSLMNMRCVSKMWSSIIRNPEFVRSFYSVSSTRPRFIVALSTGHLSRQEALVFFFSFSADDQANYLAPTFEMVMSSVTFGSISGSCYSLHGLLAVDVIGRTAICNPCTEQSISFSTTPRYVGYDPIAHQYKVFTYHRRYVSHGDYLMHRVITLGGGGGWRDVQPPATGPYSPLSLGVSITGFIYYSAYIPAPPMNPCIMCFDVATEKITCIKAPHDVVRERDCGRLIDYNGKLASIVGASYRHFEKFDLWVLEDMEKHEWSKRICLVPRCLWDFVGCGEMSFHGTNKAGEIIMAPKALSRNVEPFYIFYYNVQAQTIRRVWLQGIGDNQEFRHSYGFIFKGECFVHIAPQHIETIDFFHRES